MIGFIDDHKKQHGVEPICKVLPIARRASAFFRKVGTGFRKNARR